MMQALSVQCSDTHLRVSWRNLNEVVTYNDVFTSNISEATTKLHIVKWTNPMEHHIIRYLAVQSYHVFESIQNSKELDIELILTKSREYRAILTECEDQLILDLDKCEDDIETSELKAFLASRFNLIKDYQMLWHLTEILFAKPLSTGFVAAELQNWLNLQQPNVSLCYQVLVNEYGQMTESRDLEQHKYFWPTVLGLGMQARKTELSSLLLYHSCANGQALRTFRDVLEAMPLFAVDQHKNPVEFKILWSHWQSQVRIYLKESHILTPYPELELLVRLFLGEREVFSEPTIMGIIEHSWYYAMVPFIFYSNPLITLKDLPSISKQFKKSFEHKFQPQDLCEDDTHVISEQAVSALFRLDYGEFIAIVSRSPHDWWLLAHLTDIVARTNPHIFTSPSPSPLSQSQIFDATWTEQELGHVVEHFILEYACSFADAAATGMTMLGLNYMRHCLVRGSAMVKHIVEHMYFPNDRVAEQVRAWCSVSGYTDLAAEVSRGRAAHWLCGLDSGLATALSWSLKTGSGGGQLLERVAQRLMLVADPEPRLREAVVSLHRQQQHWASCRTLIFVLGVWQASDADELVSLVRSRLVAPVTALRALITSEDRLLRLETGLSRTPDVHEMLSLVRQATCSHNLSDEEQHAATSLSAGLLARLAQLSVIV